MDISIYEYAQIENIYKGEDDIYIYIYISIIMYICWFMYPFINLWSYPCSHFYFRLYNVVYIISHSL